MFPAYWLAPTVIFLYNCTVAVFTYVERRCEDMLRHCSIQACYTLYGNQVHGVRKIHDFRPTSFETTSGYISEVIQDLHRFTTEY